MDVIGTDLKININIEPIDGISMDMYDFSARFFVYCKRGIIIPKHSMIKVDANNYIALVDTKLIGIGKLFLEIQAEIPDTDFPEGFRTEIATCETNITITK